MLMPVAAPGCPGQAAGQLGPGAGDASAVRRPVKSSLLDPLVAHRGG